MTDTSMDDVQPHEAEAEAGVSPVEPVAAGQATEAGSPAIAEGTPPAQPEPKPEAKPEHWSLKRMGEYAAKVREREAALAERDRQIAELTRRLNPQPEGQQPQGRPPTHEDFNREVQRVAGEQAKAAEAQRAFSVWDEAGVKASPTFHADCAVLAHLGARENPAAVQVLMDMDDSPSVVARLAADPTEAERILALPPHRMALALAKFAAKAPPAAPLSRAPAPLTPVAGTARVETDPDKMSMEDYMKWRAGQDAKRK